MGQYFLFCSCQVIALACLFGKMTPVTAKMDAIYLRLSAMDNSILHASGNSPANKIEDRITLIFYHARLYLAE